MNIYNNSLQSVYTLLISDCGVKKTFIIHHIFLKFLAKSSQLTIPAFLGWEGVARPELIKL